MWWWPAEARVYVCSKCCSKRHNQQIRSVSVLVRDEDNNVCVDAPLADGTVNVHQRCIE